MPPSCNNPESNSEVCDHVSATTAVLRELRQTLETVTLAPLVVVVGDHAPPFSNKLSRQAFLQDKVPAAVLVPKVFGDDRGFFFENYNQGDLQQAVGLDENFVQANHSKSSQRVPRDMNYQNKQPQ
jgi:hypothetical protein